MFQKLLQSDDKSMNEVNMTPLIDVSLVLVVILLLATPLAFESSIVVRRAMASARQSEAPRDDERIEMRVISDEEFQVNKETFGRDQLTDAIRTKLEGSADQRVTVTCDDGVSHGAFVFALDAAKVAGAAYLAVVGQ